MSAPLRSMTGFGSGRASGTEIEVTVEAKSVNGRFFKSNLKLPPALRAREGQIEQTLKERLRRGSVTLSIELSMTDPEQLVAVNEPMVRAYQASFARLNLNPEVIPTLPGVLQQRASDPLGDAQWGTVAEALDAALGALVDMREREGSSLFGILERLLDRIDSLCAEVTERAPQVVTHYRAKLEQRLRALLEGSEVEVSDEVLVREAAVFADRADVTEELDRLGAHLKQARDLLAQGGEVGRTLEFLAQEMHREVNTIGSKANDGELAARVVQLKSEVEKVKEQVANIE